MGIWSKRALETLAMAMIGDGVLAVLEPKRHIGLWYRGPDAYKKFMDVFLERPGMTRAVGAAEAGLGLWVASRMWQ